MIFRPETQKSESPRNQQSKEPNLSTRQFGANLL